MTDVLKPRDAQDVAAAIQWALGQSKTLDLVGAGSKRELGRPTQTDAALDLSGLTGVTLYEPEELVLSARAGTPIAEIEALLASRNQELAFEPMDYGPLLGSPPGRGTIGGTLAANLAGPRRFKAGAARDHFLGVTAISGRGEAFKSGGRVVKNVTGYDLCKLLAGSWGTLAAMTDVTVKTLPRAESEATLLVAGLDDARAVEAMATALQSSCDLSGAAHLSRPVAARLPGDLGAKPGDDGDAARGHRALGHAPDGRATNPHAVLGTVAGSRRAAVARSVDGCARCGRVGGERAGRRPDRLAHLHRSGAGRQARPAAGCQGQCRARL